MTITFASDGNELVEAMVTDVALKEIRESSSKLPAEVMNKTSSGRRALRSLTLR